VKPLVEKLSRLGLIRTAEEPDGVPLASSQETASLLALCNAGLLMGGLSVALDVRPDELIGPLAAAIGGSGLDLKVIDARDKPRPQMTVRLGAAERTWTVATLAALVEHLNELFRDQLGAKAVAILGEYEDALQLWALEKAILGELLREEFFHARNRAQLAKLAQAHTSC